MAGHVLLGPVYRGVLMPWTRRQVKLLLSKASPLTDEQKAKMKDELHNNPALGHKKKKKSAKVAGEAGTEMLTPLEIDRRLAKRVKEASKAMKLSDSHQQLREQIQTELSRKHRADNPYSEYLDHPYVVHTFGDNAKGTVVYRRGEQHMAAPFKAKNGENGRFDVGDAKPVSVAYIHSGPTSESLQLDLPGITFTESLAAKDETVENITYLQEAAFNKETGQGMIKIIGPGAGSSGYWTSEALKQAVKDKVWDKGTQMFLDHPTEEERKQGGTGSLRKLVAKFDGPAVYKESHKDGEGVYAPVVAYDSHRKFLNERSADIGTSVNVLVKHSNKMRDGVPIVESIYPSPRNTVDFVSRAGAGGKLVQMFESFRAKESGTGERQPAAGSSSMEINEQEYTRLKEAAAQVPVLMNRLDRLDETNQRYEARSIAVESLTVSGLKPRGQKRILDLLCGEHSVLPLTADKKLDVAKFKESLKTAIDDETAYLQESGGNVRPVVTGMGDGAPAQPTADDAKAQEALLKTAKESLDASINAFVGAKEVKS